MKTHKQIQQMWKNHLKLPFPSHLVSKDIADVCLLSVDTYSAGCIDGFVVSGSLDTNRVEILKDCLLDLDKVLPHLEGQDKEYFDGLKALCVEIVKNNK